MRFLRARALDQAKAELMLVNMLKWRAENRVNRYLEDYRPQKKEMFIYTTGGVHKYDSDGDPLYVDRLGQIDAKGIIFAFGEEEILKASCPFILPFSVTSSFLLLFSWRGRRGISSPRESEKSQRGFHFLLLDRFHSFSLFSLSLCLTLLWLFQWETFKNEKMEKIYRDETVRQGRLVERGTVIMDLGGLGMKHLYTPAIQALRKVAAQGEANYPERLKRCFIINAPSIFPRMWNLVKNFFDPRTQKKIFILGSDYYSELVKYIPEENIPAYLGGKSTIDGDIYCKADIRAGGTIPQHLLTSYSGDDDDDESERKITVKAGEFFLHVVEGETNTFSFFFFLFHLDPPAHR